ncbi:MAG: methyl-accepting chemotaxis protein [Betaproteobacteria bacterium]|nr:methyl-accepting chemotaxis protein [Rhodocyclales bacterium]
MKNMGLGSRLYGMLAVALLPLLAVVGYMAYADSRRANELSVAFDAYDLTTQRATLYKRFLNGVADAIDTGRVGPAAVEALTKAAAMTTRLAQIQGQAGASDAKVAEVLGVIQADPSVKAVMPLREPIRVIDSTISEEAGSAQKRLAAVITESTSAANTQVLAVALTALFSAGLAAFLAFMIVGNLSREVRRAVEVANRIAAGDLEGEVEVRSNDEIGQLMAALQQMKVGLRGIVGGITDSVRIMAEGEFNRRMTLDGKQGFDMEIGRLVNDLGSSLQASVGGNPRVAVNVAQRIAGGDLSVEVPVAAGDSRSAMAAMSAMRSTLEATIADIRELVRFAADGNFSRRMEVEQRQGYAKLLGELLNRVMGNAEAGLSDIQRVSAALAEGDLTHRIDASHLGQFGETAASINMTIANLRTLIADVAGAAEGINVAVTEIAVGNLDLSKRTEAQAIELERVASTIDQLASAVQRNAKGAAEAQQMASAATGVAERGGAVIKASVATMGEIAQRSAKIGDVISVIDGIAFQTNLLALNAAVEAARAGEAGRGFAVVATEVRSLAQRSADAARETSQMVRASLEAVKRGTEEAEQTGRAMDDIVAAIGRVDQLIAGISRESEQQASRFGDVNKAIGEIERTTQANAALVEEAAGASESLKGQLQDLRTNVARFRLDSDGTQPSRKLLTLAA